MNPNKENVKFTWYIISLVTLAPLLADGYTSINGIANIIKASNETAWIFATTAAIVVNIIVACSHIILKSKNTQLIIIWILCLLIDLYTTFVVVIFHVILGYSKTDPIDWTKVQLDWSNTPTTIAAFVVVILLSLMSASSSFVVEKALQNYEEN